MAFRSPRLESGSAMAWSTTSSSFAKLADLSTSDPARIAVLTSNWSRRPVSRISGGQPASCNRLSAISHAPCEGRSRSSNTAASSAERTPRTASTNPSACTTETPVRSASRRRFSPRAVSLLTNRIAGFVTGAAGPVPQARLGLFTRFMPGIFNELKLCRVLITLLVLRLNPWFRLCSPPASSSPGLVSTRAAGWSSTSPLAGSFETGSAAPGP